MNVDLTGKVALITGAAGAIGTMTVLELARNGAVVFLNDINEENGWELCSSVIAAGGKSYFLQGSVTSEESMEKFVNMALDQYGRIDILINNVGHNVNADGRKPIFGYDPDKWHKVVDICLDSMYFCCKYVLPGMVNQRYGKIVNLGSIAGWEVPLRLQSPYCAAKAAVVNLTKSMALEYSKYGITVNCVVPGSIMNEQIKAVIYKDVKLAESMLSHIPAGKCGEPLDIANAVLYLSSDDSKFVTGSALVVDGGWTCGYALDLTGEEVG
jgi:3-oxoacyl-[acyl-carrier protein] reductase